MDPLGGLGRVSKLQMLRRCHPHGRSKGTGPERTCHLRRRQRHVGFQTYAGFGRGRGLSNCLPCECIVSTHTNLCTRIYVFACSANIYVLRTWNSTLALMSTSGRFQVRSLGDIKKSRTFLRVPRNCPIVTVVFLNPKSM